MSYSIAASAVIRSDALGGLCRVESSQGNFRAPVAICNILGALSRDGPACKHPAGPAPVPIPPHAWRSATADRKDAATPTPNDIDHTLPVSPPQIHTLSSTDHEEQSASQSYSILLVDDDQDIRSLTRTFLEHTGFRVFTAADAQRAQRIFRTCEQRAAHAATTQHSSAQRIDLLIADQYMPLRSGMELALELKQIRPELPVLLISGGVLDTAHLNQLSQPGWSFLPKPFCLPDLLSAVHRILAPAVPAGRTSESASSGFGNRR